MKKQKVIFIILLLLAIISSCTILVLDSIPYLYIDIFDVPISNVILSNTYFGLIAVSIILYELSKYEFPERVKKRFKIFSKLISKNQTDWRFKEYL